MSLTKLTDTFNESNRKTRLIGKFNESKRKIDVHLGEKSCIPLYDLKDGGDGFSYSIGGFLQQRFSGLDFTSGSTPANLLEAYHRSGESYSMEKALKVATRALNRACRDLVMNL